jgi:hypothetical protein
VKRCEGLKSCSYDEHVSSSERFRGRLARDLGVARVSEQRIEQAVPFGPVHTFDIDRNGPSSGSHTDNEPVGVGLSCKDAVPCRGSSAIQALRRATSSRAAHVDLWAQAHADDVDPRSCLSVWRSNLPPASKWRSGSTRSQEVRTPAPTWANVVGARGFEPLTSSVSKSPRTVLYRPSECNHVRFSWASSRTHRMQSQPHRNRRRVDRGRATPRPGGGGDVGPSPGRRYPRAHARVASSTGTRPATPSTHRSQGHRLGWQR